MLNPVDLILIYYLAELMTSEIAVSAKRDLLYEGQFKWQNNHVVIFMFAFSVPLSISKAGHACMTFIPKDASQVHFKRLLQNHLNRA